MNSEIAHIMPGTPPWAATLGVCLVLLSTFLVSDGIVSRINWDGRINLLASKKLYRIVKSRWFQTVPQMLALGVFILIVLATFVGGDMAKLGTSFVWTIWWAWLAFAVTLAGPVACFFCPWDAITNIFTRFPLVKKVKPLTLNLPIPGFLKTLFPASALFYGLTWLELIHGASTSASETGFMGLGMAALALIFALMFGKKIFCRSLCFVGRISGLYSNMAPVEIRAKNPQVCESCVTEECLNGGGEGQACPTGISLKTTTDSTYCTGCTECITSCPYENVAVNIRPFGAGIQAMPGWRFDEAFLMLSILILTLFHGLAMTTIWENFAPGKMSVMRFMLAHVTDSRLAAGTIGMALYTVIIFALYALTILAAKKLAGTPDRVFGVGKLAELKTLFVQFAFPLLPTAVFYHMAHNLGHIGHEGPVFFNQLGAILGLTDKVMTCHGPGVQAWIEGTPLFIIQTILIVVGHMVSMVLTHRTAKGLYNDPAKARRAAFPLLIFALLLSLAAVGLGHADMMMRMTRV